MGHSFTNYKEMYVHSKDYKVKTWLFLIIKEASSIMENEEWLKDACAHWEEQAVLSLNGCIDPNFDHFLTDEHRVVILINLCKSIYSELEKYGEKIPKEYLNELCRYDQSAKIKSDVDTEHFLSYGRALISLLEGTQSAPLVNV